jgi:hypothetical protein
VIELSPKVSEAHASPGAALPFSAGACEPKAHHSEVPKCLTEISTKQPPE